MHAHSDREAKPVQNKTEKTFSLKRLLNSEKHSKKKKFLKLDAYDLLHLLLMQFFLAAYVVAYFVAAYKVPYMVANAIAYSAAYAVAYRVAYLIDYVIDYTAAYLDAYAVTKALI